MEGISITDKSFFGTALVVGRNGVPNPATGMTAFLSFIDIWIKRSFSLFALPSLGSIYTRCRVSSPDALSNVRCRYSLHILRKHRIHRRRAASALLES